MSNPQTSQTCPLCESGDVSAIARDRYRDYLRCAICDLVFVPPTQHISLEAEKARYDQHRNSPDDLAYRGFLSRLFVPLQQRLAPGSRGLDFGSGPGPTLSVMFEEAGYTMALYDPFYAPDVRAIETTYDFITATEVVEHLREPRAALDRLWSCLKPGGILGLMTKLAPHREPFTAWHYTNDETHICYFSRATFEWLAARWQADVTFIGADVILLHKRT